VTALSVSGVWKSYPGTSVLRGVSLEVQTESLTAILGASGAGKTTLLRVIAGFEAVDAGTVALGGLCADDGRRRVPPERRHIGYVPQDGALFPHLTVRGNVAFALPRRARARSRSRSDVDELLALVGLSELGGRYPHELSGGQQQRVAIARALAPRPRLVLLDEPFAALDASLRATVRADVLGALRATGTAAVLVTHDQDEALSAADYVAVLRDGVITHEGTPRSVYSAPADPWTAGFLGTANLLPGTPAAGPSGSAGVRTALGWHELRDSGHLSAGAGEVTVLIRPEQITLSVPSSAVSAATAGAVSGKVTQTRYHGHDALIAVDVPEAGLLQVRELGTDPPAQGDEVSLTVSGPVMAWQAPPTERGGEPGPVETRKSQGTV
jgi:iron(III) transport system ATP-binding protein